MITTLMQMCGRCTRNENDESKTYILDGSIVNALKRGLNKLPSWFRERIH